MGSDGRGCNACTKAGIWTSFSSHHAFEAVSVTCCIQHELSLVERLSELSNSTKHFDNQHVNSSPTWTRPFDNCFRCYDA